MISTLHLSFSHSFKTNIPVWLDHESRATGITTVPAFRDRICLLVLSSKILWDSLQATVTPRQCSLTFQTSDFGVKLQNTR